MRYTFECSGCGALETKDLPVSKCDSKPRCACGAKMARNFMVDWRTVQFDTSGAKDHNNIPNQKQVASRFDRGTPEKIERQFKTHIEQRRQEIVDAGGQRGSFKQTHAVPAHLYHGKIKETGDANYWKDPKNLNRHNECKVD